MWEQPWPAADPAMLERDTQTIVVQINGKVRDKFEAPAGASKADLEALARGSARIQELLEGKEPVKTIVVPGKLVNLVVR